MSDLTSEKVAACQCESCRGACENKPGWFAPKQIAPLARKLGLSQQQLFDRHLSVDWFEDPDGDVFILSPKLKGKKGGEMCGGDPRGTCAWFMNGKCAIHEKGKPLECARLGHGPDGKMLSIKNEKIADMWRDPKQQKKIRKLLGREPETSPFIGGGLFGGIFGGLFND